MNVEILDQFHPLWRQVLQDLRHDFYHLPSYVGLEAGRIHAVAEAILIQEGDNRFFLPYLLRSCGDLFPDHLEVSDLLDVVSPYGYPGMLWNSDAPNDFIQRSIVQLIATWKARQICTAFLRLHPLLNRDLDRVDPSPPCQLHSETIGIDLTQSDAEIWRQTRPEHRNKINKCRRAGLIARIDNSDRYLDPFLAIYTETMDRVGASSSYYFSRFYLERFLDALAGKYYFCVVEGEQAGAHQILCAGLFTECDGIVQYHLGGTRSPFLKRSPSTLMFDQMRHWAKQRGNTLFHLGGGVGGKPDSLHHFKAGFSQQRYPFQVMRLVIDPDRYRDLVELRAKTLNVPATQLLERDFFPIYRDFYQGVTPEHEPEHDQGAEQEG